MKQAAKPTRHNRTITVDFQNEATYFQLLGDGKALVEFVLAFLLSLGLQLLQKGSCNEGGSLTATPTMPLRLGGLPSGVSSARGAKRSSRCCRTVSCGTVRCARRWLAMRCWPPMVGSVWSGARSLTISHPWPSIAWSVRWATRDWSWCLPGVVCPYPRIS